MTTTFDDWWKTVATTVRPPTLNESARVVWEAATLSERERCAAICDVRSADHWRAYSDKSSPHFCDARFEAFSDESEECATLIRGDNAELTGARDERPGARRPVARPVNRTVGRP